MPVYGFVHVYAEKKEVLQTSLRGGTTKSCGCLLQERLNEKQLVNLTGKQFGKWTVLKEALERKQDRYWLCKCACGNEREVAQKGLMAGNSKSCGCNRIKDLRGGAYGKLTVLERAERRNGRVYWRCECQCGNRVDVRGESLKNGNTKSCGCLKRGPKKSLSNHHKDQKRTRKKIQIPPLPLLLEGCIFTNLQTHGTPMQP